MKLTFTQKEFDKFRFFQDRLTKEFGDATYIGTDNAIVMVEYSTELKSMLRPYSQLLQQFEYELSQLSCEFCKRKQMFFCIPGESQYVCDNCLSKKKLKS